MQLTTLLVLPLLVSVCQAWWFLSDDTIQTATSVDRPVVQSCLDNVDTSNCAFYSCFDQRLPCGREGYMSRHGLYYCNRLTGAKDSFNPAGQTFIEDAQRCMMSRLRPHYSRQYFDCHQFEHEAVANITQCFLDNNFCAVLRSNHRQFWNVFQLRDLFSPGANKIWREVVNLATRCTREALTSSLAGTSSQLSRTHSDFLSSLTNTRDNLMESLSETHSDVMDTIQETRDQVADSIGSLVDTLVGSDDK